MFQQEHNLFSKRILFYLEPGVLSDSNSKSEEKYGNIKAKVS